MLLLWKNQTGCLSKADAHVTINTMIKTHFERKCFLSLILEALLSMDCSTHYSQRSTFAFVFRLKLNFTAGSEAD